MAEKKTCKPHDLRWYLIKTRTAESHLSRRGTKESEVHRPELNALPAKPPIPLVPRPHRPSPQNTVTSHRPPAMPPSVSGRSTRVEAEVVDKLISDQNSGGGRVNVTADAQSRGCRRLSGASGRERVMSLTPTWEKKKKKEASPEYSFLWQSVAPASLPTICSHTAHTAAGCQ